MDRKTTRKRLQNGKPQISRPHNLTKDRGRELVLKARQLLGKLAAQETFDSAPAYLQKALKEVLYSSASQVSFKPYEAVSHLRSYHNFSERRFAALMYAAANISRKCEGIAEGDRKLADANAYQKFLDGEEQCKLTNYRLAWYQGQSFTSRFLSDVERIARYHIRKTLGKCPEFEELRDLSFTGGASTQCRRSHARPDQKWSLKVKDTTLEAAPFLLRERAKITGTPDIRRVNVVPSNFVICVYKDETTSRTIAMEPTLNMLYQRAYGEVIRRRLRRRGVELNDQGINQRLAYSGWSTIDFENASNSLSRVTVKRLLPREWYDRLDILRSHRGYIKELDRSFKYNMFSSMGNGFTFELESLIFWAIAIATAERLGLKPQAHIHGDDLVVPREMPISILKRVFTHYGFRFNLSKTFFGDVCFRESCGKHYIDKFDVTPPFIRSVPVQHTSVMLAYNTLYTFLLRIYGYIPTQALTYLRSLVSNVPQDSRLFGPCCVTDSWFSSEDVSMYTKRWNRELQFLEFKVLSRCTKKQRRRPLGRYFMSLNGATRTQSINDVQLPVSKFKCRYIALHRINDVLVRHQLISTGYCIGDSYLTLLAS